MKIEYECLVRQLTIEEFAEEHDLTMRIVERAKWDEASFVGAETKAGSCCLHSTWGKGTTPEAAIKDYATKISEKTIVLNAWFDNRKEIVVPRLVE